MQHQDPPAREEIGPEHSPEELLAHLRGLEAALLEPEVRYSELLEQHLAEDFVEFGSSGRRYSRAEVIAALAEEGAASTAAGSPPIRWSADHFELRLLAPRLALLTYRACRHSHPPQTTLRSSLWRLEQGRWRIAFHQGTRVAVEG